MEGNTYRDYGMIGWAVNQMLMGNRIRRRSWVNIKWIAYVPKGTVQIPHKFTAGHNTGPFLVTLTKDGVLVPWLITQGDLLANDWEIVHEPVMADREQDRLQSA